MITIVDFGMGNLRSIQYKLEKAGVKAIISSNPTEIESAKKLILPGVGHFKTGMENLKKYNLIGALNKKVLEKKTPILGICLGMQLFTLNSEEGNHHGLGWINAKTIKFKPSKLKVPHVGWNTICVKEQTPLFNNIDTQARFYFTHSYFIECEEDSNVMATTDYGNEFVSVIHKDNIFGTQFHPEKSHLNGFEIIKNFARI